MQALQRQQRAEAAAGDPNVNQQEDNECQTTGSESSPMGFSSCSPVSSVTSPLTPNQASSWFLAAANFGAFKPPPPRTTSHHDPRDEKHPLSICQLTGGSGGSGSASTSSSLAAAICAASAVANSAALLGLR